MPTTPAARKQATMGSPMVAQRQRSKNDNSDKSASTNSSSPPLIIRSWPLHREARGLLRLSASTRDESRSVMALCSIQHGTLTLSIQSSTGAGFDTVMAKISVDRLMVSVFHGRFNMLHVCCQGEECEDIYCFATDQTARNKWIAVFRRMNVFIQTPASPRIHTDGDLSVTVNDDVMASATASNRASNPIVPYSKIQQYCVVNLELQDEGLDGFFGGLLG